MMRILDVRWTPAVNVLVITCECGRRFEHLTDRWIVRCPCGRKTHIEELRNIWFVEHQQS
jgi:hypothetical protein